MKRTRKQGQRILPGAGPSVVIRGVTPGSTRRPPGSSRTTAGRLPAAASTDKSTRSGKNQPAAALSRWESDGGPAPKQPAPRKPATQRSAKDRKAEARAKGSKIKRAGLESRLLGHISSTGKRNQARRDSKSR